jgi:hypothetical protein
MHYSDEFIASLCPSSVRTGTGQHQFPVPVKDLLRDLRLGK